MAKSQKQKRARANTQTGSESESSPQRIRVEKPLEQEQFTLFDEAEVSEMVDLSPFDGQLSDFGDPSEAGSDLPPLTPSPVNSELGADELDVPASTVPSGDWTGVRKASNGYCLSGSEEDLNGPEVPGLVDLRPVKLNDIQKELIKKFSTYLVLNWPSERLNSELADDRRMVFADPTSFWHALFELEFRKYLDYLAAAPPDNRSLRLMQAGNVLLTSLKNEIKERTPFLSGLLLSIHTSCVAHLSKTENKEIRLSLNESYELGKKMKAARQVGHKCAKTALWIPITRCDPDPVLNLHMAETKPLYDRGVKSGAIDGDGIMVGVPEGWRLMGAPPARCKSSHSLIFWEPINEDDCEPTLEKEVGACIHGAEKISPIFGDPKSAYIRLQCATAVHNLKTKTQVERNIKQAGYMTKDAGQHASYGVPYELLPSVPSSKSTKPTKKTIKRLEEQSQLRMDMKKYNAGIQSINFALMQGFLPMLAAEQYAKAVQNKMLNQLGRPNTSSFATYAYCAGLHLDKDESITHGWVIKRGKEVKRRESNFVWGNYKLILELNEGTHWFWRANIDAHGTTTNKIPMTYPGRWKSPTLLDEEENAQWTRVNTIPKAVANAMLRSQQ